MSREIVPLGNSRRIPEHGRIRLGVKTAKAMKSIDTFRFTSMDREALESIASIYGGSVQSWTPQRSKISQWEVLTTVDDIRVFLPPDSVSVWYEEWSGGGLQKRCDGIDMQIPVNTPDGSDIDIQPCKCDAMNKASGRAMTCQPYTRLRVILPEIPFGGVWRLESKGWNAFHELPGMAEMLEGLQAENVIEGRLLLEKRKKTSSGQTRNFVVPRLVIGSSPLEILSGSANITTLSAPKVETMELDSADTIVEAEIVEEGWDSPPAGVSVKINKGSGPKYIPA